jgi:hypothetical protein
MSRHVVLGLVIIAGAAALAGCFNRNQQCMRPTPPCCPPPADPCCTPAPILQAPPSGGAITPPPPGPM